MNKSQSFKLFKLKEWLTLPEVATHLSGVCKKEVSEADILRMALNKYLKLSVYFVNKAYVIYRGEGASHKNFPLKAGDDVRAITGLWDLPMLGNGRLDIEDRYQSLTGGPKVSRESYRGGVYYVANSFGTLFRLRQRIDTWDDSNFSYLPADNLPPDSVLVVRTEALREFEQLLGDNETEEKKATKPHGNEERFAKNRMEILGAALSVLARWPDNCKDGVGNIKATKIRVLIENKSYMFWREDGEPPLSTGEIEKLIRQWLNKTAD